MRGLFPWCERKGNLIYEQPRRGLFADLDYLGPDMTVLLARNVHVWV